MSELTFIRFRLEHYGLYVAWSQDAEINRWLGNPTQKWLDYVLTTTQSFTWMIYERDVAVAHIQIDPPETDATEAQVTIMIAPHLRRRGYGRRVLTALFEQPELAHLSRFYAYIEPDNSASIALFRHMGYEFVRSHENGYDEYAFRRG